MPSNSEHSWLAREIQIKDLPSWTSGKILPPGEIHPAITTAIQELRCRLPSLQASDAKDRSLSPFLKLEVDPSLPRGGFRMGNLPEGFEVSGKDGPALLHGVHHLLRELALGRTPAITRTSTPAFHLRLVTQWDNLDGTIERGYAGESIFDWRNVESCLPRVASYARMLASLGLNGIVLNNVTAQAEFLSPSLHEGICRLAGVFREHGLRIFLSANMGAPLLLGDLPTADPCDARVRAWWRATAKALYSIIPDFGGFCVKADCETVPGPHVYGRSHAEGANCIAEALEPYGGTVLWRTFVYPLPQNQTAYHYFGKLDGAFAPNVVLMIKNGPLDFQPVEPLHPLFGSTPQTRQMLEVQVIQEYTGQTTHICHLGAYWSKLLNSDIGAAQQNPLPLHQHLASKQGAGIAAVSNIGNAPNWFGHPMNGANLFSYGRLAWDPNADAEAILRDWIQLTLGDCPNVVRCAFEILAESHAAYCAGTHPYGLPFLTDYNHFRPMPEHRGNMHDADGNGVGKDRSSAAITGSWRHYPPRVAEMYSNLDTCPGELLLFFHHVPWSHLLSDGRELWEAFEAGIRNYPDTVERWISAWRDIRENADRELHAQVSILLSRQRTEALLWRDHLLTFFRDVRNSGRMAETACAPHE